MPCTKPGNLGQTLAYQPVAKVPKHRLLTRAVQQNQSVTELDRGGSDIYSWLPVYPRIRVFRTNCSSLVIQRA